MTLKCKKHNFILQRNDYICAWQSSKTSREVSSTLETKIENAIHEIMIPCVDIHTKIFENIEDKW